MGKARKVKRDLLLRPNPKLKLCDAVDTLRRLYDMAYLYLDLDIQDLIISSTKPSRNDNIDVPRVPPSPPAIEDRQCTDTAEKEKVERGLCAEAPRPSDI